MKDPTSVCTCGHTKRDHIYEEGACRPGFVCESACEEYCHAPSPEEEEAQRLVFELEWSRATAIGEAVWLRICGKYGKDPKSPQHERLRDEIVGMVRSVAFVIEQEGFDGIPEWLSNEARLDDHTDSGNK